MGLVKEDFSETKMTEEFNLSECIEPEHPDYYPENIPTRDVKEFIRRLKPFLTNVQTLKLIELAGEVLSK